MVPRRNLRPRQPEAGDSANRARLIAGPMAGPAAGDRVLTTIRGDRERVNVTIGMD